MNIIAVIRQIASFIMEATSPTKPDIKMVKLSYEDIQKELQPYGLMWLYRSGLDESYYSTSAVDLAEMIHYIYCKYQMPRYIAERMDCDDFAFLFRSLAAAMFGVNCVAVVFGRTPGGYHAWDLVRTEDGWLQFEPQTGDSREMNYQYYKPEVILI